MGGKNAVIVLPDADLDHAARLTAAGAMRYAGQKCTATSRAIVAHEVEGAFIERPRAQIDALPLGPVTDAACADGPVLATFTARDVDDANAIANGTRYGLSASLFTRDVRTALEYVHRIEVGLVRVNGGTTGVDPHAPFGGMKGSSSGSREQGSAAREFYTEVKTVQLNP